MMIECDKGSDGVLGKAWNFHKEVPESRMPVLLGNLRVRWHFRKKKLSIERKEKKRIVFKLVLEKWVGFI